MVSKNPQINTLFLQGYKSSKLNKVKAIHKIADLMMLDEHHVDSPVCKKGCSACCKMSISVHKCEAEYIKHRASYDSSMLNTDTANCPFLSDSDSCLIYEWRPLVCRTYFAYDNSLYCNSTIPQKIRCLSCAYELHSIIAQMKFSYDDLGGKDIREWFIP